MPLYRCPSCKAVLNIHERITDFVHNCNDFPRIPVLGVEDVQNTGRYTDVDGNNPTDPSLNTQMQTSAIANTLELVEGRVEHPDRVPKYNARGNPVDTVRSQSRFTYFETKDCKM